MAEILTKCIVPWCGAPIDGPQDFKDALSVREFHISGMCQKCQDAVFEAEDPEYADEESGLPPQSGDDGNFPPEAEPS